MNLPRSSGVLLHVTSLPGGRLGTHAFAFVDWLAAAGQTWWQVLPLGAARPLGLALQVDVGVRGLARAARRARRRPCRAPRSTPSASAHGYWIGDWERFAGAGAVADQVRFEREWGALRRYARERGRAPDRRRPDLRRRRAAPTTARTPSSSSDGVVAGAPPDALARRRASSGATRSTTGPRCAADGYRWWIERLRRDVRARRPRAHRPLPRLRRVLGGARAARATPRAGRWRRGPGRAVFDAARARARRAAADRRGPRRDHAAGRARCARELGLPGMVVLQFGFARRPREPAPAREPRRALVVYTGTHDTDTARRLVGHAQRRGAPAATGLDAGASRDWALIELALASPAAARDRSRRRTCSASAARRA